MAFDPLGEFDPFGTFGLLPPDDGLRGLGAGTEVSNGGVTAVAVWTSARFDTGTGWAAASTVKDEVAESGSVGVTLDFRADSAGVRDQGGEILTVLIGTETEAAPRRLSTLMFSSRGGDSPTREVPG
jgi:hypothetical protein